MFWSKVFHALVAVSIAGVAGAGIAGTRENDERKQLLAVLGAQTSAEQAIAIAERQTGGRAVKLEVGREKSTYLYEVKTAAGGTITEVLIEPGTGQIVRSEVEDALGRLLDWEDWGDAVRAAALPIAMTSAIAAAEQHSGGKAIEASLEDEDGAETYEVEVAKEDGVQKVSIDTTGKVVKMEVVKIDLD